MSEVAGEFRAQRTVAAAHEQRRIDAHVAPLPHQSEGNPLDATGLETVEECQDPQETHLLLWLKRTPALQREQ